MWVLLHPVRSGPGWQLFILFFFMDRDVPEPGEGKRMISLHRSRVPASRKALSQGLYVLCLEVRAGKLTAGPRDVSEAKAGRKRNNPARCYGKKRAGKRPGP